MPAKPLPRSFAHKSQPGGISLFDRHYNDGVHHLERHRLLEAIQSFEMALASNPPPHRQAAILFSLATAARRVGQTQAAEDLYHRVLTLEPGRREALVNLSNLYRESGKLEKAQSLLGSALEADPSAPELWLSLGHVMRMRDDLDRARMFFAEAVRLKPNYAQALGSLADLLVDLGKTEDALNHYDAALRKDPHNAQLHLHRGLVLLSVGRTAEGWRDYAWRHKVAEKPLHYRHNLKKWDGRPLTGRRLLICAEQGLGDQLIFASLFAQAIQQAQPDKVFIECESRLTPLFQRSFPQAESRSMALSENGGSMALDYDWLAQEGGASAAAVMGDLPGVLQGGAALAQEAAPFAYLRPDLNEWRAFKAWLETLGPAPYLGICWRSGKLTGQRVLQFAPFENWTDFVRTLPGTLVSLQYDATADELSRLVNTHGRPVHVPAFDQKNEIDRLAALTAALDLVITAPTAVSALSSAVGTTTLKILYDRSWTALGQSFEPLAPACRHIRPQRPGAWDDIFAKAHKAVEELLRD